MDKNVGWTLLESWTIGQHLMLVPTFCDCLTLTVFLPLKFKTMIVMTAFIESVSFIPQNKVQKNRLESHHLSNSNT